MTFKNALKFGIIMSLVMCTAFYIISPPEHILGKTVYSLITTCIGLLLAYFILGKENMKRK
ncbi:hypothetical protein [Staphylococcus xylosus]|uniref:hypothetical protein n=1 Tax=Staphylococcus xylosus TaxID=1288 RepID=UPI002DB77A4B|nr:hypothetical protein [Staphylococcus xylosus]MEB6322735.1 hypothetical protein [Staphylococcus xylosus]MEB7384085.1 hypothetical protein [Staphylococcus xylosus]MEB7831481.1 hypothetical protein [Staphylococcus xylosus]MEB8069331.1 hypothetical protein [Staphylococcus xylosus]